MFVVRGPRAHRLYETDAAWVVEVLSPSTTSTDMREKAAAYASLPGLQGYLLVDPDLRTVRLGRPDGAGGWAWLAHTASGRLGLLGADIDLADLWGEVDEVAPA